MHCARDRSMTDNKSVITSPLVGPAALMGSSSDSWPGLGSSLRQRRRVNLPSQQVPSLSEAPFQTHEFLLFIFSPVVETGSHLLMSQTDWGTQCNYRQNKHQPFIVYGIKHQAPFILKTTLPWTSQPCCKWNSGIAQMEWSLGNDSFTCLSSRPCSNKDIKPSIMYLNKTEKSPLGEILLLQSGRDLQANQSRFAHKYSMQAVIFRNQ